MQQLKKFLPQSEKAVMTWCWQFHWELSGKKTWGQHLSRLCPPSKEAECVTMHAILQAEEKYAFFFCLAVLVAVLQLWAAAWLWEALDVTWGVLTPAAHDKCCRAHPPTQYHFRRWLSRGQRVGWLSQTPSCHASCIDLPSHGCLLPYLPVWSTSLAIWISACLRFSPPTLPASLLSLVPFWLPASTLPNTQPPYLPPPPPPYATALLPYPNCLISYPPSVQLVF